MMVKIGVIFMPFSNPTCHLPSTANLPVGSFWSAKYANLTVQYITGTYFFSGWPELSIQDIVRYVLKL